jgi:hypothetical protein
MNNSEKERLYKFIMPIPWSGCWEWMGQTDRYGKFSFGNEQLAHRASWIIHNGTIPDGLNVLHKCDNPSCVNPEHLFLGTHTDNMQDKIKKGRANPRQGEAHPMAKYTEEQVRYIRTCGKKSKELAMEFGCNYTYIDQIKRGDIWTKVL